MGSVDPLQLRGQVLDDLYRVEACVSEDAYSVDYAGLHLGIDEPITIKCLKVPASLGTVLVTSFARRFHDVNRTYARLSQANSNIHKSFAGGTTVSSIKGSLPYIVLEWLEGRTLADEIKQRVHEGRGGRSFDEAYEYLEPALSAITCAHRLGAVHTDINPTRFFLARSKEGEVFRVRDFCIAKIMSDPVLDPERKGTTRAHVRIFSPAYAAPEQFDERVGVIGTWTDVYAMALVFLEVIEGQHDLDGLSSTVFADESMLRSNRVRARIDALGLSPEVASVFEAALQPSPKERLRNGGELQAKLRAALAKNREASKPTRHSQFPRSSTGSSSVFPNAHRDGGAGFPERRPGTVTDLSALARDVQIREDDSTEARKQTGASDASLARKQTGASDASLMVTAAEGHQVVVPRGKTSSSSSLTATEAKAPPSFERGDERRTSSPRLSNTGETATASLALGASMDSLGPAQTGVTAFSPRSTAETSVRVSPMGSSGKPAYGFVERPSATDSHELGQEASERPTPLPPLPEDYESSASIAFDFRDKRASAPAHPTMPELPSSGQVIESDFQPTPEVPQVHVPEVAQAQWHASDVLAQTMQQPIVSPVLREEVPALSASETKNFGTIEEPVPPDETTVPGAVEGWAQPEGASEAVSGHSPLLRSNGWAQGSGTGPYRNNFIPFGKAARPSKFVRAKQAGLGLVAMGLLAGAFVVASSKFRGEGAESMIPAASAVASKPAEPAPPPPREPAPANPSTPTTAGEARPSESSDEGSFLAPAPSAASPAAAFNGAGQPVVATPAPKRPSKPAGIDRNAARASLDVINSILASCKKTGTVAGPGRAAVTFENDGTVSKVDILGKPYVGTPEGTCVASRLRKAKVAPFHGAAVTLDYAFTIRK